MFVHLIQGMLSVAVVIVIGVTIAETGGIAVLPDSPHSEAGAAFPCVG